MPEIMGQVCSKHPFTPQLTHQPVRAAWRLFGLSYAFNLTGFGFLGWVARWRRNGADKDEPNRTRTLWWVVWSSQ